MSEDDMSEESLEFATKLPCRHTPPSPFEQRRRLLRLPDDLLVEIFRFEEQQRTFFFNVMPFACRRFNNLAQMRLKDMLSKRLDLTVDEDGLICQGEWSGLFASTVIVNLLARGCQMDYIDFRATQDTDDQDREYVSRDLLNLLGQLRPIVMECSANINEVRNGFSLGTRLVRLSFTGRCDSEEMECIVTGSPFLRELVWYPSRYFQPCLLSALRHASQLRILNLEEGLPLSLASLLALAQGCGARLEELKTDLSAHVFREQGIAALATMTNLQLIHFSIRGFLDNTSVDLAPLQAWKRIRYACLSGWPFEYKNAASFLTETKNSCLVTLYVLNAHITDEQVHLILKHNSPTLTVVHFIGNGKLSPESFANLSLPRLANLSVSQEKTGTKQWDKLFEYVQEWPALEHLDLRLNRDCALTKVSALNPRLQRLLLFAFHESVDMAQSGLRNLKTLQVLCLQPIQTEPYRMTFSSSQQQFAADLGNLRELHTLELTAQNLEEEVVKQALKLPLLERIELCQTSPAAKYLFTQETVRGKQVFANSEISDGTVDFHW